MKSYRILDLTPTTHNYKCGRLVFDAIVEDLNNNVPVSLDFTGVTALPSSFLNGFLGEIETKMGLETLKRLVKPTGLTRVQAGLLKDYVNGLSTLTLQLK